MLCNLLAYQKVSDDLSKFLHDYFGDKKLIRVSKTISSKDSQIFVELRKLGLVVIECVHYKRCKEFDFSKHGAVILLTENGKIEIEFYKQDLKFFLLIEAQSPMPKPQETQT